MKRLLLMIALGLALAAHAAEPPDARLSALQAEYARVSAEQQTAYQQFLMATELRRNAMQDSGIAGLPRQSAVMGIDPRPVPDYDETMRRQREREQIVQRYELDANAAYARFLQLGTQKQALMDQIIALTGRPPGGR